MIHLHKLYFLFPYFSSQSKKKTIYSSIFFFLSKQAHFNIVTSKHTLNRFHFPFWHFPVQLPVSSVLPTVTHLGFFFLFFSNPSPKNPNFQPRKTPWPRTRTTRDPFTATTTTTDLQSHPKNTIPLLTSQTQKTPHHHNHNNNNNNPKSAQLSPLISTPQTSLRKSSSSAKSSPPRSPIPSTLLSPTPVSGSPRPTSSKSSSSPTPSRALPSSSSAGAATSSTTITAPTPGIWSWTCWARIPFSTRCGTQSSR